MQNKQKALFAGNRVRCKVTSSGSEHKQSSLPAHLASKYWAPGINSASLPPPVMKASPWRCISLQSFSECFLGQKQGEQLNRGCWWSCYNDGTGPKLPTLICTHPAHSVTGHLGIFPVSWVKWLHTALNANNLICPHRYGLPPCRGYQLPTPEQSDLVSQKHLAALCL